MISASKAFKEKLKKGANVVNYADFTLSDGTVLHLEPKDFMIGGCQIEDKTTDGKFGVGFAIGKTLTLRIANHDERFSRYDFYGSIINLYVALKLDNGTIEKIRKGVYYTIVPETPGDIIEISAVDGMFKLDRDYSASKTTYPATLQRIISDACLDCGIPIGFRQFDNMSYTVKEKPDQGTYRQIISYACQIAGYNARIDNNGYMQLVWYNTSLLDAYNYKGGDFHNYPHDTVVNGGNFKNYGANTILSGGSFTDVMPEHIFRVKSINVHTDDVQITGVRVSGQEEKTALFGEEGYLIEVKENPFANGNEQAVANYLGGRMVGMVFRPFSAEVLNNPLYEPFDIVRASDAKGNVYYSLLNSVSYKIGSYTTVACEAEDPVRNGSTYVSAAAQAVVEARRDTEKQLTTYDKAVQNMNQLAANAMGLFFGVETQSDGSVISYESTKPITVGSNGKLIFESGSTVYKKTGDGFFVSTNGGKTYTAGFNPQGNTVLNVLYAIGISADWINAGSMYANFIKGGLLSIGDEKNGITMDGKRLKFNKNGEEYGHITTYEWKSSNYPDDPSGIDITSDYGCVYFRVNSSRKDQAKLTYSVAAFLSYQAHEDRYGASESYYPVRLGLNRTPVLMEGNLAVRGSKSRIAETKNYRNRLLYCYEMSSPMFGDIGEGEIDENGECIVAIDDIFSESVTAKIEYQVFLQKEGMGDLWVDSKNESFFTVKGTPNLRFAWEVKVLQKDYEYNRLEEPDAELEEMKPDYEQEYDEEINYLIKSQEELLYETT